MWLPSLGIKPDSEIKRPLQLVETRGRLEHDINGGLHSHPHAMTTYGGFTPEGAFPRFFSSAQSLSSS
jgi:hypothetical protein